MDSLVTVLNAAKQDSNKVILYNNLATKYISINNTAKALAYADSSEMLASMLNYKTGKANAIVAKAQAESKKGNRETAVAKYKLAADIFRELGNKISEADMISNVAFELVEKDNYAEALRYRNMALKLYEELNNKDGLMTTYLSIGIVYRYMANYSEALKNTLIGMNMAREIGSKYGLASALRSLSVIYQYEKKREASLNSAIESLKIFEELGDKTEVASVLSTLGVTYALQQKYDEAINTFAKAMEIYSDLGDRKHTGYMYNQMGVVKSMQNKLDESLNLYRYALQLRAAANDKWGVAESEISIGALLSKQASLLPEKEAKLNYDSAIIYISKGAAVMKEIGYKQAEQNAYRRLSETYVTLKDYKMALEYKEMHLKIRDSIMNDETAHKLEQQRTQYEVEKVVAEEKLQQEKALAEQKFQNEKKIAEENTKHQLALVEEQAKKEKAIEIEKLKYDFALAEERTAEENRLTEQKFENEKNLAEQNALHQQQLSDEKAKQEIKDAEAKSLLEKEKAEKKQRSELYITLLSILGLVSTFVIILIRQRNLQRRGVEKAEAGHKMAELELQSLRAQLNPHFMFNSLNAIQDLILKEDNDRSHLYLSRFSKLLRMLLDNANQPFVSVKQELEFLELYLSLENLRIPDLQFSIEKDPKINTEERMVPNMMLQPYIENAIWHGLSNKKGDRKLLIRIHENGNATEFEIEDNGIGRKKAAEKKSLYRKGHTSKGMELLSKRFSLLSKEYGASIQTTITDLGNNGDAIGTLVIIDVPFSLSEQARHFTHDTNHNN